MCPNPEPVMLRKKECLDELAAVMMQESGLMHHICTFELHFRNVILDDELRD